MKQHGLQVCHLLLLCCLHTQQILLHVVMQHNTSMGATPVQASCNGFIYIASLTAMAAVIAQGFHEGQALQSCLHEKLALKVINLLLILVCLLATLCQMAISHAHSLLQICDLL